MAQCFPIFAIFWSTFWLVLIRISTKLGFEKLSKWVYYLMAWYCIVTELGSTIRN